MHEAAKDRPCAVIVAVPADLRTIVAPVTHRPPDDPAASIEIPDEVCRALGLDQGRHWLRTDELNRFVWPGYDLRPIPGHADSCAYGMLTPSLFEQLREAILARQRAGRGRTQRR